MSKILPKELHQKINTEKAALIVDVREPFEHGGSHIAGSKNIPLNTIADAVDTLKKYSTVYVHCNTGVRSAEACGVLREHGINVVDIEGGISAWEDAGLPVVGGKKVLPLMRQVMIVAGSLILLGVLLGYFVHMWWYGLAGFVGAGLLFAGVTGYCGMTHILKHMPWNKVSKS